MGWSLFYPCRLIPTSKPELSRAGYVSARTYSFNSSIYDGSVIHRNTVLARLALRRRYATWAGKDRMRSCMPQDPGSLRGIRPHNQHGNNPMKTIALISEHASPLATLGGIDSGGQNVYVANVARQLAALGYTVDVFTRRDHASQLPMVQWAPNLRVIHVPAGPPHYLPKESLLPFMDDFAERVIDFAREQNQPYDVMHANFFMSGLVALRVRDELDIPFAITFHALGKVRRQWQGMADGFSDLRFEIEETLAAEADAIIAECRQDRADLCELYNAPASRISVVPCGFDPAELAPQAGDVRGRLGLAADEFVVLHVGRMVPRKGVDTVIRAIARLKSDYGQHARLLIVGGDGPQPDPQLTPHIGALMELAREQGVAAQVTFTGQRQRAMLSHYYSAADVFVTTPWYEPFGITPLEAMACGTPVIGSAVGGIKDTVADGVTGFLVPPKDPAAVAQRLAELQHNAQRRQKMGAAGLSRVHRLYTWREVTDKLLQAYRGTQTHTVARLPLQVSV